MSGSKCLYIPKRNIPTAVTPAIKNLKGPGYFCPFKCRQKPFKNKLDVDKHILLCESGPYLAWANRQQGFNFIKSPELPFRCDFCKAAFAQKIHFFRHVNSFHLAELKARNSEDCLDLFSNGNQPDSDKSAEIDAPTCTDLKQSPPTESLSTINNETSTTDNEKPVQSSKRRIHSTAKDSELLVSCDIEPIMVIEKDRFEAKLDFETENPTVNNQSYCFAEHDGTNNTKQSVDTLISMPGATATTVQSVVSENILLESVLKVETDLILQNVSCTNVKGKCLECNSQTKCLCRFKGFRLLK